MWLAGYPSLQVVCCCLTLIADWGCEPASSRLPRGSPAVGSTPKQKRAPVHIPSSSLTASQTCRWKCIFVNFEFVVHKIKKQAHAQGLGEREKQNFKNMLENPFKNKKTKKFTSLKLFRGLPSSIFIFLEELRLGNDDLLFSSFIFEQLRDSSDDVLSFSMPGSETCDFSHILIKKNIYNRS